MGKKLAQTRLKIRIPNTIYEQWKHWTERKRRMMSLESDQSPKLAYKPYAFSANLPKIANTKNAESNSSNQEGVFEFHNFSRWFRFHITKALNMDRYWYFPPSRRTNDPNQDEIIEKTIWLPESLKTRITKQAGHLTINDFVIIALSSWLSKENEGENLLHRINMIEKRLDLLQQDVSVLNMEHDLNLTERFKIFQETDKFSE